MRIKVWAVAALVAGVLGSDSSLVAQIQGVQYTRVLVPVVIGTPTPGALGSMWTTEFVITNSAPASVSVFPLFLGGVTCDACTGSVLSPNSTARPFIQTDVPGNRGTFLYVDRGLVTQVAMSLRVRDLSRALETYGTSIPVVQEDRFVARTLTINDIPATSEFRQTLRIYGLDTGDATPVIVRLFGRRPASSDNPFGETVDVLLGERMFILSTVPSPSTYPTRPAFLEIGGLDPLGGAQGYPTTRIDVIPASEGKRLWAFVSVTNNTTQHVTALEPVDSR
jgi:hypothetical protein